MLKDEKGITFSIMSETEAAEYLSKRNNYMRTASYRKNYAKHETGAQVGKYINLDFAYLAELSNIDFYLREHLLKMCIDIEHALKVALLAEIEQNPQEDGYKIVCDFLEKYPQVKRSIEQKADAIFTGDLINKYFNLCYVVDSRTNACSVKIINVDCPVWVLAEIISFGDLIKLCEFYSTNYRQFFAVALDRSIINPVKSLRNACAHNNCLFTSLRPSKTTRPPQVISRMVASIPGVAKVEKTKKLSSRPVFEIVCMLYEYQLLVSPKVRQNRMGALKQFVDGRMIEHLDYFSGEKGNRLVKSTLLFIKNVVDFFA